MSSSRLFSVLIFCILSIFMSCSISLASSLNTFGNCAVLRSQENGLHSQNLIIRDGQVLGNIPDDEFANATQGWNVSGYWTVNSGCELTTCVNPYLTSNCSKFAGNSPPSITSNLWQSAKCRCNQNCTCSNLHLHKDICARAYLEPGGCNTCDAPYTELDEGSNPTFPEDWVNDISSFLLRPGCTIKVYEEENYEGQLETIEDWNGTIRSYECQCNDVEHTPEHVETENEIVSAMHPHPPTIEIPETLDAIVSQLRQQNYNHSGLLAAFSSLTHRRSSKNAYILLIGSTGAGKSSAINNLLNNPNVTLAGDTQSTTHEILEFRIPISVDELGVSNSELRIIDTPGLGDTRGLQHDAIFLATLDEYLSQHSELKNRIPNLVLVFHPFTDNRFDGEGAKFVQMIRGLDSFRSKITDEKYSNVLFVLSHFCSEGSQPVLRNPSQRLRKFKEVIEECTLFPKPIMTSVIENHGKENELPMINGNYELPNKELFPLNLLDKFDTITSKGEDEMGRAIINKALRYHQEYLNVSKSHFQMVSPSHHKVAKFLATLSSAILKFENTEVSQHLAGASESMPTSLKTQFPTSLECLKKYLDVRNIRAKTDLPQTTGATLELLKNLEKNEAVLNLLEKGLNLTAPVFPTSVVVGQSFNIFKYAVLPISPFKLDALKTSQIGFRLPDAIQCQINPNNSSSNFLENFDTREQYVRYKLATTGGIKAGIVSNINSFTGLNNGKIKDGYFVSDTSCSANNNTCAFVAFRNFKLFQFDLDNEHLSLTPAFIQRVTNLSPFDESNYQSVQLWNDFFNDYGTHVVKSGWGGGRIAILVDTPSNISLESLKSKLFTIVEFAENLNMLISGEKINPKQILPEGATYSLVFYGGGQSYHTSDLTALNLEDAMQLLQNWKASMNLNPVVYPTEFISIHKAARSLGLEKSKYIMEASSRLLNSTLTFKPPPTPDPTVKLEEVARQRRENERKLEVERRRMERQRRRLAIEEEGERKRAEFMKAAGDLMQRISLYKIEIRGEKEQARLCREYNSNC